MHELSKLAIACDIELGSPGLAERILKNDESVCRRRNPKAFRQLRQHLMALNSIEEQAIRVECLTCGEQTDASVNRLVCAACGDYRTQLVSGDELLLKSIELERRQHA